MKTHFDPEREAAFRIDYASKSLASVRFGLLLGAVLYALFAVLDIWMLPESWRSAHWIRFAVVVPICLGALALTFVERVRQHLQALVSTFVIVGGLGIIAMIALAQESEPAFRYYYAGLLLVLTFSFTVVRLRFLPAALCCLVIIATYELVAVWDQGLLADGLRSGAGPVFLNNNFFLVAAGVITLIGSYVLENYARTDFRQRNIEDNADVLRSATQRVRQTLEVLKRFSHLDKAETTDYDVKGALADCLTLLAHETGSRIVVEQHLGEIPKIRCRPAEINQLFMSLLKNAIQAIPDTGVIEVRTCAQNGSIRIDIADTGVGIAEDRLKDLFVPKFSHDRSRVKLGLALMTSHSIVHRHGGTIDIESRVGKGTRVSIILPQKGRSRGFCW